ncbi:hypothetical protein ACP70R_000360 [Stipagrostis hirtigluma subsp. patula]
MPPLRRAPRAPATPYTQDKATVDGAPATTLPDDLLFAIFSRVSSGDAGVARCAATCRHWGRVIAARAAALARALPPLARFLPHLALGVLRGPEDGSVRATRRRRRIDASPQPRFVPTASASPHLGASGYRLLGRPEDGGLFDRARPVASRKGRVVLELRRGDGADVLALGVCNPMMGDVAVLPPLAGDDYPGCYACAIVAGDDLDDPPSPGSFQLLLVYNRRSFTALRSYSSDAGSWGPEGRMPGAKMSAHMLRHLGPAVVLRGVVYWPVHLAVLGVRLDGGAAITDVCSVPYRLTQDDPEWRLLGISPDGGLSYISAGVSGDALLFFVETLPPRFVDDVSTAGDRWERGECVRLPQIKLSTATAIKLRWFGEKSGTTFFTIGKGSNTSGAFAANLATKSVEKLADGLDCDSWLSMCGYEMDRAGQLASIVARFI